MSGVKFGIPVTVENAATVAKQVAAGELPGPAKSLAEAMARIYADGGRYVQKTGQMQGVARYSYAKEGDFIAALRPLMEVHGVTIRPVGYQVLTNEQFERKNGGAAYRVVVLATFEFTHLSGDKATAQAIGEGQDSGDKAFNKAMTGAMKYVLRQSFCVETGDDPDDTPSHEQERKAGHHPAPSLADRCLAAIKAVGARNEIAPIWHAFEADAKAGKFTDAERAAINAAFKEAGQKFPAPAAKA